MQNADNIIMWRETDANGGLGLDYALSFQESAGCTAIWYVSVAKETADVTFFAALSCTILLAPIWSIDFDFFGSGHDQRSFSAKTFATFMLYFFFFF